MAWSVAEAVERAWLRCAQGETEAAARLYRDRMQTWVDDACHTLAVKVAEDEGRSMILERSYAIPVDGAGGANLYDGANGATPSTASLLSDFIRTVEHSSGVPCQRLWRHYQFAAEQPTGVIWYVIRDNRIRTIDADGTRDGAALGGTLTVRANFVPTVTELDARSILQDDLVREIEKIARANQDVKFAAALLAEMETH